MSQVETAHPRRSGWPLGLFIYFIIGSAYAARYAYEYIAPLGFLVLAIWAWRRRAWATGKSQTALGALGVFLVLASYVLVPFFIIPALLRILR